MPVFITDRDALQRMAQVEGDTWLRLQESEPETPLGFRAFARAYADIKKIYDGLIDEDRRETMREIGISLNGHKAIYGEGGWNRYFIRWSGEIVFSARHATSIQKIEKAKAAGFRTSEEA